MPKPNRRVVKIDKQNVLKSEEDSPDNSLTKAIISFIFQPKTIRYIFGIIFSNTFIHEQNLVIQRLCVQPKKTVPHPFFVLFEPKSKFYGIVIQQKHDSIPDKMLPEVSCIILETM